MYAMSIWEVEFTLGFHHNPLQHFLSFLKHDKDPAEQAGDFHKEEQVAAVRWILGLEKQFCDRNNTSSDHMCV